MLFALAVVSIAVVITLALSQNNTDYTTGNGDGALLSSLAENNENLDIDKPLAAAYEEDEGVLDAQGPSDSGSQQVYGTAVTTTGSRDNEDIIHVPDSGHFQLLSGTADQLQGTGPESSTPSPDHQSITRDNAYYVQAGSWKNPEYANNEFKRIRRHYPAAYLVTENNFHVIRIPGIANEAEGAHVLWDLNAKFNLRGLLISRKR